jgi:hypothetical protein
MTMLSFPGELDTGDPTQRPGGCEFGAARCVREPELLVEIPGTSAARRLCREHAGWSMLSAAAASPERATEVLVRRVA